MQFDVGNEFLAWVFLNCLSLHLNNCFLLFLIKLHSFNMFCVFIASLQISTSRFRISIDIQDYSDRLTSSNLIFFSTRTGTTNRDRYFSQTKDSILV